jgi:hypothetical protein
MKKITFITLFAGMVLSAGAQNTNYATGEEKQKILEELERNYEMEIYGYFSIDRPAKALSLMPWDAWAYQYRDEYQGVSELFGCLENLSVEPVEGEPKMCRLVFRGKSKGPDTFQDRRYIGNPWEAHIDSLGTYIGFREKIFYGLTTDVELHLTNKKGKPILADLDWGSMESVYAIEGKKSIGNGESEVWFGIDIPLDSEFSKISDGTVTVRFAMPDEYDIVKVKAGDGSKKPVQVSFKDLNFKIEKIDSIGFVISADMFNRTKIDKTNCLFRKDGIWYEPLFAVDGWGFLDDILEYNGGNYTFEKWLKKKGIDPENLKETMREYRKGTDSPHNLPDIFGKHYRTGMNPDTILFYKPSAPEDERIFSESTVRIIPSRHKSNYTPNKALRSGLLEKLKLMQKKAEAEIEEDEVKGVSLYESIFGD